MNIITELIDLLSSKAEFKNYFNTEIEDFSRIKKNIESGVIRIGLIGITSSGKSTLINSILGEQLLPQKVKPSSNILVVCNYEKIKKATIFFEDDLNKTPEVIHSNIAESLEKYGDEDFNPSNVHQVKEIHLVSPNFKLSKSISLVDSPGLDAYEMEHHEKLTLQLALPTLDLVIYLTTVKASSDKENLNRIDEITTGNKPIIVVQNMIDSIVPKIIKGGIVAKNENEIKKEHYLRLTKILLNGKNSSTKNAKIIQLSARQALDNQFKNSNVEQLFKLIEEIEIDLKIKQRNDRIIQLNNKVSNLIKNLSKENKSNYIEEENEIQDIRNDFKFKFNIENISPKPNIKILTKHKNLIISKIELTNDRNQINDLINSFLVKKSSLEEELSILIKETHEEFLFFGEKLNITTQDMKFAISNTYRNVNITIPTINKTKIETKTFAKKGVFARGARFFGNITGNKDWGYENIEKKIKYNVIDKRTLSNSVNTIFNNWVVWYIETYKKYNNQRKKGIEKISEELNYKDIALKEKQDNDITEINKNELISKLTEIMIRLKVKKSNKIIKLDGNNNYKDILVEELILTHKKVVLDIFNLAQINGYSKLLAIRNFCLNKLKVKSIFIWGWDSNDLNTFINLFFISNDMITDNKFSVKLRTDVGEVTVFNESNFIKTRDNSVFKSLHKNKTVIFVNADLSQPGLFEKKYNESQINNFDHKEITWVIQGVDILLKSDSLIEAIVNFCNFLDKIKDENKLTILSSKDPFYSLLIYELIKINDINKLLITDERNLIKKIGKNREEEVSRFIKQYRELKTN